MNKICLYYGIICGVFLTSTAAPAVDCTVGTILYNDGQCHEIPPAGVEPAGVVFDTAKRLAVGLNSKVLPWGGRGIEAVGLNSKVLPWGGRGIDVAAAVNCSSNKTERNRRGDSSGLTSLRMTKKDVQNDKPFMGMLRSKVTKHLILTLLLYGQK